MHIEYLISRLLQLYQNVVQYHNVLSNLIDTFTYMYRVSRFNRSAQISLGVYIVR